MKVTKKSPQLPVRIKPSKKAKTVRKTVGPKKNDPLCQECMMHLCSECSWRWRV
jgi:hypothetical protein